MQADIGVSILTLLRSDIIHVSPLHPFLTEMYKVFKTTRVCKNLDEPNVVSSVLWSGEAVAAEFLHCSHPYNPIQMVKLGVRSSEKQNFFDIFSHYW